MSDVLGQSDIDALLGAVTTGEIEPEADEPQIFSRNRRHLEQVEIKDYDFKRPERISKDQMRALQTLHEAFARNYGVSLSGFMRTIVEVRVAHCEQMTYSEFIAGLPNPTSFNLINAAQFDGQLCFEISPLIIYPIIDRLLGGSNQDLFIPQRPMTLIESRLIQTIVERAVTALDEAWASVRKVDFSIGAMESNPQIVQIVPPNEVVVVIGFEVKMTNRAGTMSLCIPFNAIEPVIEDLSAQNWFHSGRLGDGHEWEERITGHLSDARIEVAGVLTETTITLSEFQSLDIGDLITTGKPATTPSVLAVEGNPKFLAHIGQHRGRRALKVVRTIEGSDRI